MRESRTCADCRCDACARCRIVGCGYAGAAAALFLERAGHAVTIYEEVAEPRAIGAGIVLRPTGMYVLDRLELLDPVLARGAPLDGSSRALPTATVAVHEKPNPDTTLGNYKVQADH